MLGALREPAAETSKFRPIALTMWHAEGTLSPSLMRLWSWGLSVASLLSLGALGCEHSVPPSDAVATPTAGTAGTGGSSMTTPNSCDAGPSPGVAPLRPLTRFQYDNVVRDLLGDTSAPAQQFPPENEVDSYRTYASANPANPLLVQSYLTVAETVAKNAVTARLAQLAPCADGQDMASCGQAFLSSFLPRAFRRPPSAAELEPLTGLFQAASQQSYAVAVEQVIQAVLQSPQFLYRVDSLRAPTTESGAIALGSYELAARLAFTLWGSTPDQQLLDAAAAGHLETPADVEREARRLLEDQRSHEIVRDFGDQWLGLSRLDGAAREGTSLDTNTLTQALHESLTQYLDATYFAPGGSFQQLFESPNVWLNDSLASIYGGQAAAQGFQAQTLPDPRFGLLTQPALLALLSHSNQTAPVIRGVFVRERFLCLPVAPPPPDVNPVAPDPDPTATTRERFRQHTEQPLCASCHQLIDGVGFGFERYDQLGRYRATENGFDVDESGTVLFSGEATLDGDFAGAGELASRIAKSPRARDCLATHWYRYSFGRQETADDSCSLQQVKQRFASSGGDLKELLVGLTQTDSFLYRPAMTEAP
jgi:uncharacterized protein DUF1588/uncharacterized protein DUF1592/uncharacterized protein DUF1595/uncharacterized protein DUF1585/uncharacterized protein DUF1587